MEFNWRETAEQRHARKIAGERNAWDALGRLARQDEALAATQSPNGHPIGSRFEEAAYRPTGNSSRASKTDRSAPVAVDIYVGGANDSGSGIVRSYADQKRREHPDRAILYFGHADDQEIADAIDRYNKAGVPVNVIGHSWGGSTAGAIVAERPGEVQSLTTIDPVGWRRDMGGHRPADLRRWDNVTAHEPKMSWNDFVAVIGGKPSRLPVGEADTNSVVEADHVDFARMMRRSGVEQRLYAPSRVAPGRAPPH